MDEKKGDKKAGKDGDDESDSGGVDLFDGKVRRGEAYRKALKTRLRAAIPRSLRKRAFLLAGLREPTIQLDSQKLKELEVLERWLVQHFPAEMSKPDVVILRKDLLELLLSLEGERGMSL